MWTKLGTTTCLTALVAIAVVLGPAVGRAEGHGSYRGDNPHPGVNPYPYPTAHIRSDEEPPRDLARVVYDAAVLRPLQLVQVALHAAMFVPAYPVGWFLGEGDYIIDLCFTEPIDRAFRRPLGDL